MNAILQCDAMKVIDTGLQSFRTIYRNENGSTLLRLLPVNISFPFLNLDDLITCKFIFES